MFIFRRFLVVTMGMKELPVLVAITTATYFGVDVVYL